MIIYKVGNLFESDAEALVNTVNTVGVMGKGIALQFKKAFPDNYKKYREVCQNEEMTIGTLLITQEHFLTGTKTIINFPTKTHWRLPSEYSYIEAGLVELKKAIEQRGIKSIAIPPLGSGNGGLDWRKVKMIIENYLADIDCEIQIFEPTTSIEEVLKEESVKLTPARAMLLSVLYDMVKNGEFVSEFSSEKVAYFLQRFGAEKYFKLQFHRDFYGPYSGKVRHVLYYLNGSYITGYSAKDKKPFEELSLIPNGEAVVTNYLNEPQHSELKKIADKTKSFLEGFYSTFGLELLSTIDYIMLEKNLKTPASIKFEIENWSHRKRTMFTDLKFIQIAIKNLENHFGYSEYNRISI